MTENKKVEAYCMKCKTKRMMDDAKKVVTKNGRNAVTGTCPQCSTKMFKFTK